MPGSHHAHWIRRTRNQKQFSPKTRRFSPGRLRHDTEQLSEDVEHVRDLFLGHCTTHTLNARANGVEEVLRESGRGCGAFDDGRTREDRRLARPF
jgi:hypothetical protein